MNIKNILFLRESEQTSVWESYNWMICKWVMIQPTFIIFSYYMNMNHKALQYNMNLHILISRMHSSYCCACRRVNARTRRPGKQKTYLWATNRRFAES